jgi:hypothetical protein
VRDPGFSYLAGLRVGGTAIWCDTARARGVTFLSRADVDLGRGRAERIITSARTAALRRALGTAVGAPLLPRFGRPFSLGRARLELVPSGALPGGAQLLVELGGWRGLYAGTILPRPFPGAEPLQARACDDIVVDAPETGGRVDGLDAALVGGDPLAVADLAAALALAAVAPTRLALPTRLARAVGLRARRTTDVAGRRLISGQAPGQAGDVLALGLGPTVEEVLRFVIDCGARRVHVRLRRGEPLRDEGARSLIAALERQNIEVRALGPPEQLLLLPRA